MTLKTKTLTPEVYAIVCEQDTELPDTGKYNLHEGRGTYLCRQCGDALFRSDQKFISSCGWPSFDDELPGRIKRLPDPDGRRTEIRCQHCDGHLGHVFHGEGHTEKNLRHCVNSLSIDFVANAEVNHSEEAIFAGGCFWGVEHLFKQTPGVLLTEVGYSGGHSDAPSYEQVCAGSTDHLEAIRVIYNSEVTSYEAVVKYFLEIHDPSQKNGQGPDIGSQYLSAIFYFDEEQKNVAENCLQQLRDQGLSVATKLVPAAVFWPAEEYHQHYYEKTGELPYCHVRTKRFS
ncbi:MAG: bifunctional methionine sulfoxide reductase B/A protein [Gammaproteobacteria bacterium]|nr:bifunctional methionine sulfoxide reductase B/A protein [Gammaproteobacteria bacterium]